MLENPATAEDTVAVIEYDGLPWCDAELRFIERHSEFAVDRLRYGRSGLMPVAYHCIAFDTAGQVRNQPVQAVSLKFCAGEVFAVADDDLLRVAVNPNDEPWFTECDPETLALSDRKSLEALMLSHDFTTGCDKFTSRILFAPITFDEACIVVVRDEANFLAVGLVRVSKSCVPRQIADRSLGLVADREEDVFQEILIDAKENVALVFSGIKSPYKRWGTIVARQQLSVMPGRDFFSADIASKIPKVAELKPVVAHHAWVRSAAGKVLVCEVIFDAPEGIFEVYCVERDVQRIGDSPGICRIRCAAATLFMDGGVNDGQRVRRQRARFGFRRAGPHEQSDDFVALLLKQNGGSRAIDSAAHCEYDSGH